MGLRHLILASAIALALPVAAFGTTIQVTGSVTAITNDTASLTLDGSVAVGTTYTASYTYDPNLVDPFATPQDATYSPLVTFQVVLGDYVIVPGASGGGAIRITNDVPLHGDEYQASWGHATVQAGSFGDTPDSVGGFFVILEDPSGAALSTNALQVPDASLFGTAIWQLFAFQSPGEEPHAIRITGSIDSVTDITPVPEPSTLSLLTLGGAVLLRRRRSPPRSTV